MRVAVAIACYAPEPAGAEGYIEAVIRRGERIELDVLLGDGRGATATLSVTDWEWLELGAGDIVPVRHVSAGWLSA